MAKQADRELLNDLKQLKIEVYKKHSKFIETEDKLNQTFKENKIVSLTLQELKEIEDDAKFYEAHGRGFILKPKKNIERNLELMQKAKNETIKNLSKNRDKNRELYEQEEKKLESYIKKIKPAV